LAGAERRRFDDITILVIIDILALIVYRCKRRLRKRGYCIATRRIRKWLT
jgi:hypothetical protein